MSKLELSPHKSVHNPECALRNVITAEIEKVIDVPLPLRLEAERVEEKWAR